MLDVPSTGRVILTITEDMDNDNDYDITINSSLLSQDLDEVGFEPIEVDDSDEELEEFFGY